MIDLVRTTSPTAGIAALILAACTASTSSDLSDASSNGARPTSDVQSPHDARHNRDASDATSRRTDAARDSSPDASADSTIDPPDSSFTTPDSSPPPPDSAPDAPVPAICPGARNVLTLTQAQPGGPLGSLTTTTLTNLDALWSVALSPLDITATPGSGASASLTVTLPSGATLAPGTYAQGAAAPDGGPLLDLSFAGNSCEATSGTFTVASLANDDAGVASLLATFALACATGPGETDELTGCVRYQAETGPVDASVPPPEPGYDAGLAIAGDAGALTPCLGDPQAFYVTGSPLTSAPEMLTGATGDWSAGSDGVVTLTVDTPVRWSLELGASEGADLTVGQTYSGAGILPGAPAYFALLANGVDCGSPSASFTMYDYADMGGDETTVTRLAATFTATCTVGGSTGTVTGCVHYVE